MCKVTKAVTQSDITVARSVARETVKGVMRLTGFPEDAEIIFTDEQVDSPRNVKNMFDKCRDDNGIRTKYQNFVFVEFDDKFTQEGIARHRPGVGPYPPVFLDDKLSIAMEPIYAESEMTITMRFRANDRARLSHWVNSLRLRHGLVDLLMTMGVRNDWSVPYRFVEFIHQAYKMREAVDGYGETFAEYCKAKFSEGMQIRSNLNKTHNELIINEVQKHTRGWVDDKEFYNSREIQEGIYECTMTYKFFYKKIIATTMYYPPTIHNQFIPKDFAEEFIHPWVREVRKNYLRPWCYAGNVLMGPKEHFFFLGDGGARILEWDDWFPKNYNKNTQTVLITPIAVDPAEPRFVFNLDDLSEEYLPQSVRTFLLKNSVTGQKLNHNLANIEIFSVTDTEKSHVTTIDADGNVYTTTDMPLRARNYARISIVKDLAKLNPVYLREAMDDPDFIELLKFYDPEMIFTDDTEYYDSLIPAVLNYKTMQGKPSIVLIGPDGTVTDRSLFAWMLKYQHTNSWFKHLTIGMTRYVGDYNITSRR